MLLADENLSDMELNNKLIEQAYAVCKRREFVQMHIGESGVDMQILDDIDFGKAYTLVE